MKMKVLQWHHQLAEQWPQIIPECHKLQLLNNFQELMSSNQLKHHTCAICGESKFNQEVLPKPMPITSYDLSILHGLYPAPHLNPFPMHPSLCNTIVCSQGISNNDGNHASHWIICRNCHPRGSRDSKSESGVQNPEKGKLG